MSPPSNVLTATTLNNEPATPSGGDVAKRCEQCKQAVYPESPLSVKRRYSFCDQEDQHIFEVRARHPNWICQVPSAQVRAIGTIIRNKDTPREEFVFYADRMNRMLIEQALDLLPFERCEVTTPVEVYRHGVRFSSNLCGVSIVRAGESMEAGLRAVCRGCRIGKILIQRNEDTKMPKLFYTKLPDDIASRHVLLMDPMLATGGSAICALDALVRVHKVPEEKILFVNLWTCAEGIDAVFAKFPNIKIVSSFIDPVLTSRGWISPGIGDFGDRYFGTD